MPDAVLTCRCPAKLNLALAVGSPDPRRNHMHPIASWMVALQFGDLLRLQRLDAGPSRFTRRFAEDAPQPSPIDWPLEKDLAHRAHRLLETTLGRSLPIEATLEKHIPTGAGLGGGSSNAAAMLVSLDELFELNLGTDRLAALGATLGSDVPFLVHALRGEPSALVEGFGERITPHALPTPLHLVLALPAVHCPTGPVYQQFDRMLEKERQPDLQRVLDLMASDPVPQNGPFNDLAQPALAVAPQLGTMVQHLRTQGGLPMHVSGSGSTLFMIAPSEITARPLARRIADLVDVPTLTTRTIGRRA